MKIDTESRERMRLLDLELSKIIIDRKATIYETIVVLTDILRRYANYIRNGRTK